MTPEEIQHIVIKKRQIKLKLIRKNGRRCNICLKKFDLEKLTIDHIKRKSEGGSDEMENLQLLYRPCHNLKDNILPNRIYYIENKDKRSRERRMREKEKYERVPKNMRMDIEDIDNDSYWR